MSDVFGKIMEDAIAGVKAVYTIERDDGYTTEGPVEQYIAAIDEWFECERDAIVLAKGKVLDIGSGAGRVLQYLHGKGIEAVGIDNSSAAIAACKSQGITNVEIMSATELDFEENTFDTVVMYGNNFGILGDVDMVVEMLRDIHRITKKDSIILACSRDPEKTDNEAHLRYHQQNREKGLLPGLVKLRIKYKGLIGDWFDLLMVNQQDMEKIATQAGWTVDRIFTSDSLYVGVLKKG
ncbi:MAG: hypothetical protein BAJATHORv1_30375 [Candidatus Thorarchaeota archaeon]|nr:MAG: hypothetical protein BAJATHORv1_30375 [Candidatus Thorarchaeota archaeon]